MKTAFICTVLIFSSSLFGESIFLQESAESSNSGDIKNVETSLEQQETEKAKLCMQNAVQHITRDHWEFDSCLTERQMGILLIWAIRGAEEQRSRGAEESSVVSLIKSDEFEVDLQDYYGRTPLHLVSSRGWTDAVLALIEKGAEVDFQDYYGRTPLHLASSRGWTDAVLALIEKGADLNIQDKYNEASPLHRAIWNVHRDTALMLIEKGADLNIQDKYGRVPLTYAILNGWTDMALVLIEEGADFNIQSNHGSDSFDLAKMHKRREVVLAITERGGADLKNESSGDSNYFPFSLRRLWGLWK